MRVVIVGQVCIDKNVSENASYTAPGGPPIFLNKVFSQIPGIEVVNMTPYGKDFLDVPHTLSLYPTQPTADTTLIYENVMVGKVRKQKAYNREEAMPIPVDENLKQALFLADIVIVAPLLPNFSQSYMQEVIGNVNKNALRILLPQGYYRKFDSNNNVHIRTFVEEEKVLPLFDMVIVSDEDGKNMLATAKEWTEKYRCISIVTQGEKGAMAFEKEKEILLPTTPVPHEKVVDSAGSGEIFTACFAYGYTKTGNLGKAGKFANAVAASCLFYTSENIQIDPQLLTNL